MPPGWRLATTRIWVSCERTGELTVRGSLTWTAQRANGSTQIGKKQLSAPSIGLNSSTRRNSLSATNQHRCERKSYDNTLLERVRRYIDPRTSRQWRGCGRAAQTLEGRGFRLDRNYGRMGLRRHGGCVCSNCVREPTRPSQPRRDVWIRGLDRRLLETCSL